MPDAGRVALAPEAGGAGQALEADELGGVLGVVDGPGRHPDTCEAGRAGEPGLGAPPWEADRPAPRQAALSEPEAPQAGAQGWGCPLGLQLEPPQV